MYDHYDLIIFMICVIGTLSNGFTHESIFITNKKKLYLVVLV